ncbi:MAG: ATP-dependent helicase [Bacteroidota bacterium]
MTKVFFDEIHHAGEGKTWGDSIQQAFDPARYKLLLSGTPFRSDNHKIPYVYYDDNYSFADFRYDYPDALRDGVCRPIFFPSYEGRMEWVSKDGQQISATFSDQLEEEHQASERLRTALNPSGEWLREVIQEAHKTLQQIRSSDHKNAGGLVLAIDQAHARAIADLIKELTGETAIVAVSDEPDASQNIERFANSSNYWIVAVRMVSEGVDIPRLRILVYATNVATELFFRQAVGRVIRVVPNLEEQSASMYMPAEDLLLQYARRIKEQRDHVIEEIDTDIELSNEAIEEKVKEYFDSAYTPISSEAQRDNVIFEQEEFSPEELDRAEEYAKNLGYGTLPTPLFAKILRDFGVLQSNQSASDGSQKPKKPLYKRKKDLRTKVSTLVRKYAYMTNIPFNEIHTEWLKSGGSPQSKASEEELVRKRAWIIKED